VRDVVRPSYLGRVAELRHLVDEVGAVSWSDPRWWALVSAIAATEARDSSAAYLLSDADPDADTFMAWPAPRPPAGRAIAEAIGLARAARAAIRELDGELPGQPLAGTVSVGTRGATIAPLDDVDRVVFAVGDRAAVASLDATDGELAAAIAGLASGTLASPLVGVGAARAFATITVGGDAWPTARHGHRRGWSAGGCDGEAGAHGPWRRGRHAGVAGGGPWLGVARAGDHLVVSTCHLAIDGFGHAWLCDRIARSLVLPDVECADPPAAAAIAGMSPLAIVHRDVGAVPNVTQLAYRLGVALGDQIGVRGGFSPTIQIPVAPGDRGDPDRWRRRVVPALVSVRWPNGAPETEAAFATRARGAISREAAGRGLASRIVAAGRAIPVPLRWKRRAAGTARPRWLAPISELVAGRACLSLLRAGAVTSLPLIAASAPGLADDLGSTVITIVDLGDRATVTATGVGRWGTAAACDALIDRLALEPA
jgi:hypothetical protein